MRFKELFELLDLEKDGLLTRRELRAAADFLGWGWNEAPLYAVLDLFSLFAPLSREKFESLTGQIADDPYGPYGKVLLSVRYAWEDDHAGRKTGCENGCARGNRLSEGIGKMPAESFDASIIPRILETTSGEQACEDYGKLLEKLGDARLAAGKCALLVVDPQRSFTRGAWMRSVGYGAENEVRPISAAFQNCAARLQDMGEEIETMFSRCPFPPDSYGWDSRLDEIVGDSAPYFIKPGNSILFPRTNGYKRWIDHCLRKGRNTLVIGGCTLNSCVRVSSIETAKTFSEKKLEVVVDLSLSGARAENYKRSGLFGGLSSVESAVNQMAGEGVMVVGKVEWA